MDSSFEAMQKRQGACKVIAVTPETDSWSKTGGRAHADIDRAGQSPPKKPHAPEFNCMNQPLASPTSSDIRVGRGRYLYARSRRKA
jgi:hypothetical protein